MDTTIIINNLKARNKFSFQKQTAMKPRENKKTILFWGAMAGLISSFFGSVIFSLIFFDDFLHTLLRLTVTMMISFIVSSIPGLLGGLILIDSLYRLFKNNKLTLSLSMFLGLLVGLVTGLLLSTIIFSVLLQAAKYSDFELIVLSLKAVSISGFLGGCTGFISYIYLHKIVRISVSG